MTAAATTNPTSAMRAEIANALRYAAVNAWLISAGVGVRIARWFLVTVAAIVTRTAIPIEPPSCWPTLRRAELNHESIGETTDTATIMEQQKTSPRPHVTSS